MVTAQPSTGGLQEGGRPEPCPVSTGPGDRDSQACVPISVPQHWPEPSGSRSGPNVDFGPTWSSTQVPGYQGPGLVGRGGGSPARQGPKKKQYGERGAVCPMCVHGSPEGSIQRAVDHSWVATRFWPQVAQKALGSSRISHLSVVWSQALQPQAQWPTQALGRPPVGLSYGEKGPALAELLSHPSLENTDPQRDRAGGLCPMLAPH